MRIIMLDLDTLRPDHLGCYGYGRDTTPNIDSVAKDGALFQNYYCPNAPCLPSRASLISGLYGIRNGIVGHGGTASDMRIEGATRGFQDEFARHNLIATIREAGLYTATISTFAERHSAWWFNAGYNEVYNLGSGGMESAEEVTPLVIEWISRNVQKDDWFLHINMWDAHTPYRAPENFGNPYENEPLADNWITQEIFDEHLKHVGPHGAREINMWSDKTDPNYPRHPGSLKTLNDAKNFIDQYDTSIKYMDGKIGEILSCLKNAGIYDDTAIIITSDHGENMGELGIYGEHATADKPTCHIPMIIKWPGGLAGIKAEGLYDNVDLCPTIAELLNLPVYDGWDGISYKNTILNGENSGKYSVVLTQCAHVCQRSALFGDYLYIRTYHGGYHLFNKEMLFNIKEDPHETSDLSKQRPDLCAEGAKIILDWVDTMMQKSDSTIDPLWTVMKEGGPEHCKGVFDSYIQRLEETDRGEYIDKLRIRYKSINS